MMLTWRNVLSAAGVFAHFCFLWPATLEAARPLAPPLVEFGRNTTAVAHVAVREADLASPTDRMRVRTIATLAETDFLGADHDAGDLTLRLPAAAAAQGHSWSEGDSLIVVYSYVRSHNRVREERIMDPDGPRVVAIRGLDQPALFAFDPRLAELISTAKAHYTDAGAERVRAKLVQLAGTTNDPATRALLALELELRPDLRSGLSEGQRRQLAEAVRQSTNLDTRGRLVQVVSDTGSVRQPWLAELLRRELARAPVMADLGSFESYWIQSVLRGLARHGERPDVYRIAAFLGSNAPGVVESAVGAMTAIDSTAASIAFARIMLGGDLTAPTRRLLAERLAPPAG